MNLTQNQTTTNVHEKSTALTYTKRLSGTVEHAGIFAQEKRAMSFGMDLSPNQARTHACERSKVDLKGHDAVSESQGRNKPSQNLSPWKQQRQDGNKKGDVKKATSDGNKGDRFATQNRNSLQLDRNKWDAKREPSNGNKRDRFATKTLESLQQDRNEWDAADTTQNLSKRLDETQNQNELWDVADDETENQNKRFRRERTKNVWVRQEEKPTILPYQPSWFE
jgi:hypothetical protein